MTTYIVLNAVYLIVVYFYQLAINAEQKQEIDRLRRELDQARMQASNAGTALQTKEMVAL